MKIGIIDYAYTRPYGVEEGFLRAAEHGYETLDCNIFTDVKSPIFGMALPEFEREMKRYRAAFASAGLSASQAHGPWHSPDDYATEEARKFQFDAMVRSLYGAAYLGCENLVLHYIMPTGAVDRDLDEARKINLAFFADLVREAERIGVAVCIENMPFLGQGLARPKEVLSLVRELDSDFCRVCLDTGHAAIFGIRPGDAVRAIGRDFLRVLHVHDNDGARDLHLPPFSGVIDWEDFSSALREIGFAGSLSLETAVPKEIPIGEERDRKERELAALARKIAGR